MLFTLDGNRTTTGVNNRTLFAPILSAGDLTDEDHQLVGTVGINEYVSVRYFEYVAPLFYSALKYFAESVGASRIENSSGGGFDLLTTGPNAKTVPAQADVVDNTSLEIKLQNDFQWSLMSDDDAFGRSLTISTTPGASLSYSFDGIAIWYDCGFRTMK